MSYETKAPLHDEIMQIKSKRDLEHFLRKHAKNLSRSECTHMASKLWDFGMKEAKAEKERQHSQSFIKAFGEGWRDVVKRWKAKYH